MPRVPSNNVPYDPVPDVAPIQGGPGGVQVPALPGAFGGEMAQAVSALGGQLEKSGDEIFTRALALQQVINDSEAREADVKFMEATGTLHAQFNSLQGADAQKALPGHIKALKEAREKIRSGLSNDAVRRSYDGQTLNTLGRNIFNAAGHAANETRQYAKQTLDAQVYLDGQSVENDPQNDSLFQDKLRRTAQAVQSRAAFEGHPEGSPGEQAMVFKATSNLWKQRIIGLSRTEPFTAAGMLDTNSRFMTEDDKQKAENTVRNSARAVGSINIAKSVYSPDKPLTDMEVEAERRALQLAPKDPILAKQAVTELRGLYNQRKYADRQEALENKTIVQDAILSGAGSVQELRANPRVAAAFDALPKNEQLAIPGRINSYIAARDRQTREAEYRRINGLSNNDVEAFLNLDISSEKGLSPADMKFFAAKQQKMKERQSADPRVWRAMSWMKASFGAQMQALGVYSRTQDNKDQYDKLTGAVQSALDTWQEEHKKPPTNKEFNEQIAPQILKLRTEGSLWGGASLGGMFTTNRAAFDVDVPEAFKEQITKDAIAAGGIEPTPEQIYRAYQRTQAIELYGKKKEAK